MAGFARGRFIAATRQRGFRGRIADDIAFATSWYGECVVRDPVVVLPRGVDDVQSIVRAAAAEHARIVPQGGNTGLVGGSIPYSPEEVVLSFNDMRGVQRVCPTDRTVRACAGATISAVNEELRAHELMLPIDLGSKGSATIGGVISTNAGGSRFFKYGSLKQSVLGMRVVLADGEILDLSNDMRKDNTGYDLKNLFVGAEGTLGVVVDATLAVVPVRASRRVLVFKLRTFDEVLALLTDARRTCGDALSAIEFMDGASVRLSGGIPGLLTEDSHYYILVETSTHSSSNNWDEDAASALLASAERDGVLASSEEQARRLWSIRENIPVAHNALTMPGTQKAKLKYDVSVSIKDLGGLVEIARGIARDTSTQTYVYGHLADGNAHVNYALERGGECESARVESALYAAVTRMGGSISAEHGVGTYKRAYLLATPKATQMRLIKDALDPTNLFNPNKVI